MTDKAYAVPLHELLASVPREARLVIDDDGMGTRFIPVGRYCNEAAEALRAALAQPDLMTPADVEQLARIEKLVDKIDPYEAQPEQEPVATLFGSLPVYDVPPAKPVAWVENLENARPHCVTDLKYCSVAQHERGEHLKYIPLYPAPSQREWIGLTDEEIDDMMPYVHNEFDILENRDFAHAIEAKLKEKNT